MEQFEMLRFVVGVLDRLSLRDFASVLKTSSRSIDVEYISKWAGALNLEEIWAAVQREAT
jgi:hypothetical protein